MQETTEYAITSRPGKYCRSRVPSANAVQVTNAEA